MMKSTPLQKIPALNLNINLIHYILCSFFLFFGSELNLRGDISLEVIGIQRQS